MIAFPPVRCMFIYIYVYILYIHVSVSLVRVCIVYVHVVKEVVSFQGLGQLICHCVARNSTHAP